MMPAGKQFRNVIAPQSGVSLYTRLSTTLKYHRNQLLSIASRNGVTHNYDSTEIAK